MSRPLSMHPLVQLFLARLREFIRTPEAMFWGYAFPLIMVVALGLAFRSEPVESFSVDIQAGPEADSVKSALEEDSRFQVEVEAEDECRRRLRVGKADLVIIAEGSEESRTYQYLLDRTRPGSVLARNATDDLLQRVAGREDIVETSDVPVTEPGSRYIDFLVPGLIGMGVMAGGLFSVGFVLVDMRMRKLLKRYMGTPMKKSHFLSAIIFSRMIFTLPEVVILVIFARLTFGVVNHGSYGTIFLLVFVGAIAFAGLGLLIASRAKTLEAVSGLLNIVMMPMWICSGIFFSAERFPDFIQPVILALPLTPLINALRAVMLEGAGLTDVTVELLITAAWGAISFALALRLFRWE